jgi:hypothetical protein
VRLSDSFKKATIMSSRWVRWATGGALFLLGATLVCAAEPVVQDFDGWKITITPGDFPISAGTRDHVPPSPAAARSERSSLAEGLIQLASFRPQEAAQSEPSVSKPLAPAPTPDDEQRELPVIVPGDCAAPHTVVSVDPPKGTVDPRYLAQMYSEIYRSIPFNRAEYDANPSYIHETTMEMLFGQLRPTVIHRNTTTVHHHHEGYGFSGYAYPPVQVFIPGVGLRIHRTR